MQKTQKLSFGDCIECFDFVNHFDTAVSARKEYEKEKNMERDQDEMVVSVDLQKVIMLQRFPGDKTAIFCKRIVSFNETFAPVGGSRGGKKATGVLWHEVKGRTGADISSTYLKFIRRHRDVKHFIF